MIDYERISKSSKQLITTAKEEIELVKDLLVSQEELNKSVKAYSKKISSTFENNEIFKNILLSSIQAVSSQLTINIQYLENLKNILDVILNNKTASEEDIQNYNSLFSEVETNINFVNQIMERTKDSFEQLSKISVGELTTLDTSTVDNSTFGTSTLTTVSKHVSATTKNFEEVTAETVCREIKPVTNASSDLLCYFPKTPNDILAISTIQNTYQISFNPDSATICIEDENFYFTLKTIGVQISDSSNVLLISRKSGGFLIITNLEIDVPEYISIKKITRNRNFVEFEISNTALNISVKNDELSFVKNLEILNNSNVSTASVYKTIPNTDIVEDTKVINNTVQENLVQSADSIDFSRDNNTLIISEKDNRVILPYKIKEVEGIYQKKKKEYSSVQDLIKKEYVVSAESFKNPVKSRFREAYQLIKKKEHGHFKEALDLGFELMFQSNLNPAIIAACKSLKELDIYLDCLDDNELDKFSCFNIVYNIPPSNKK